MARISFKAIKRTAAGFEKQVATALKDPKVPSKEKVRLLKAKAQLRAFQKGVCGQTMVVG